MDETVVVDGQVGDVDVVQVVQSLARAQNGGVLGDLGDHVGPGADPTLGLAAQCSERGAADGQRVGLGAAAGEDHLVRAGADQRGDLAAGVGQGSPGMLTVGVAAEGLPNRSPR